MTILSASCSVSAQTVELGYADTYEKLPKLTFETISEEEFLTLTPIKPTLDFKPEEEGKFFYLQTALTQHAYKKYDDYGDPESWNGFECLGYYPTSKLFAITENSTSESLGFGELLLVDSLTDYHYRVISFGDGSVTLPIPSTNQRFFVYFDHSVYQHKSCDIGVLRINDKSNPENYLSEHASYHSDDFAIEALVWKTDHCFYVKGYEEVHENGEWVKKYTYYKTEFE